MNITEKILSKKAGHEVVPGEIIEIDVDLAMSHDGTSPPAIKTFEKIADKVWDSEKIAIVFDHNIPANTIGSAEFQKVCRDFIKEQGISKNYIHGEGICHQVLPEMGLVEPGKVIVGADSHTCTYGALGAFATGVGSTDMAAGMATGKAWFKVPPAIRINLTGKPGSMVSGKDVILTLIGMIGVDGALYKSLEFSGPGVSYLSMDDRLCICNMAIEAGAKNGIFPVDETTIAYLKERTDRKWKVYEADDDAPYEKMIEIDLSSIVPTVSFPHLPSNTHPATEGENIPIDQIVIGSCTNGRLEDMEAAYSILKGRHVAEGVRAIIIPATMDVYKTCIQKGYAEAFIDAGCIISTPTCGPCLGGYMGILADGERCVSTTNRNFVGRMGAKTSEVYLASPYTAAASAIDGHISDPRKYLEEK